MLLSRLEFGSYFSYTPRGESDIAKRSKNTMILLKSEQTIGNPPRFMSQFVAERMRESINQKPFRNFFNPNVSLVPVPKTSLMKADTLWVPEKIAEALSRQRLGVCYPCLKRIKPIPKAAYSEPSERPKAIDHYNSIICQSLIPIPHEIVLIDDIVTRGSTLLGCASKLREFFPDIPIRAFAVFRTISDSSLFKEIEDSCVGEITLRGNDTFREP